MHGHDYLYFVSKAFVVASFCSDCPNKEFSVRINAVFNIYDSFSVTIFVTVSEMLSFPHFNLMFQVIK